MTPAAAIAMLDRQVDAHGQTVTFHRGATTLAMRGFVREFKPEQLVGLITEQDRLVVLSPSVLSTYGTPKELDDVSIASKLGKVQSVGTTHIDDTLVRLEVRVRLST